MRSEREDEANVMRVRAEPFPASAWRRGLTLVELLTSMAIVAILAAIAIPIVVGMIRGDRVRRGSLLVQGALINARERAALDGLPRGVRFIPDDDNPEYCRQIIFIREGDAVSTGRCVVSNGAGSTLAAPYFDVVGLPADEVNLAAFNDLPRGYAVNVLRNWTGTQYALRGSIRFERAGKIHAFTMRLASTPADADVQPLDAFTLYGRQYIALVLDEPFPVEIPVDAATSGNPPLALARAALEYEIPRPPAPLEGADPVFLPNYTVVDLGQLPDFTNTPPQGWVDDSYNRLTRLAPRLPQPHLNPETNVVDFGFEVMFSPDGRVIGNAATDDRIILWVRDENNVQTEPNPGWTIVPPANGGSGKARREILASSTGGNSLVVLSPRTGFLGTFKPVLQDLLTFDSNNGWTNGPDGYFDWDAYYENVFNNVGVND